MDGLKLSKIFFKSRQQIFTPKIQSARTCWKWRTSGVFQKPWLRLKMSFVWLLIRLPSCAFQCSRVCGLWLTGIIFQLSSQNLKNSSLENMIASLQVFEVNSCNRNQSYEPKMCIQKVKNKRNSVRCHLVKACIFLTI